MSNNRAENEKKFLIFEWNSSNGSLQKHTHKALRMRFLLLKIVVHLQVFFCRKKSKSWWNALENKDVTIINHQISLSWKNGEYI